VAALRPALAKGQASFLYRIFGGYRRASAELATLLAAPLPGAAGRAAASAAETPRTRDGSCRSAGRRECGGRERDAHRLPDRPIRGCRRSYKGAAGRAAASGEETPRTRDGSCRSAGRRECGARERDAHRLPDRPIRGCRRSYKGAADRAAASGAETPRTRDGSCRSAGRRECGAREHVASLLRWLLGCGGADG